MRISIGLKSLATLSVPSFASSAVASNSTDFITTKQLYEQHCTACHAAQHIGGADPALSAMACNSMAVAGWQAIRPSHAQRVSFCITLRSKLQQ
jgi:mono/diheme cytochrome c family protein